MHRIDHATAVAVQPAQTAPGTPGYFSEGDPALGAQATVVTKDWANAIQEEIAHVIEAASIDLEKTDNTQLFDAIMALILANVGGDIPIASTTVAGIVELATSAETATGTDGTRAVTPAGAVATFLRLTQNLGDLPNAGTARTNLGLGTAALVNTGTGSTSVPTTGQADARYARVGAFSNTYTAQQNAPIWNTTSSLRYKRAVEDIDAGEALRLLAQIRFVRYELRRDGAIAAGVVAEELAETELDFCVARDARGRPEAVNYQPLFTIACRALQGVAERLDQLERAIGAGGA